MQSTASMSDSIRARYMKEYDKMTERWYSDAGWVVPASTAGYGDDYVYTRYEPPEDGRDCDYCGAYVNKDRIKKKGTCQNCGAPIRMMKPEEPKAPYIPPSYYHDEPDAKDGLIGTLLKMFGLRRR